MRDLLNKNTKKCFGVHENSLDVKEKQHQYLIKKVTRKYCNIPGVPKITLSLTEAYTHTFPYRFLKYFLAQINNASTSKILMLNFSYLYLPLSKSQLNGSVTSF